MLIRLELWEYTPSFNTDLFNTACQIIKLYSSPSASVLHWWEITSSLTEKQTRELISWAAVLNFNLLPSSLMSHFDIMMTNCKSYILLLKLRRCAIKLHCNFDLQYDTYFSTTVCNYSVVNWWFFNSNCSWLVRCSKAILRSECLKQLIFCTVLRFSERKCNLCKTQSKSVLVDLL